MDLDKNRYSANHRRYSFLFALSNIVMISELLYLVTYLLKADFTKF